LRLTREIKTAILVIASILLFIWGYSFLKGKDLFSNYKTLYVTYDNVEGLMNSAPITLNGLVIGKVKSIEIDQKTAKLLVTLQIATDFPISKSSVASIYEPGFIGGKQIAIEPNMEDKTLLQSGDYINSNVKLGLTASLGNKLVPFEAKLTEMVSNADKMLVNVNSILDYQTQQNLKLTIAELSKTMAEFHKVTVGINGLLAKNDSKINGIVTNFEGVSSNFKSVSDSLNKANIASTVNNLNKTLAKVDVLMANLNAGKGTMGKLMTDDKMYANFTNSSKELSLLLQDLRLYPTRYVNVSLFGKKNKPYISPVDTLFNIK
jgi:phospholipid/cholesterol/gamma-HCH transport system substrate-binding protein